MVPGRKRKEAFDGDGCRAERRFGVALADAGAVCDIGSRFGEDGGDAAVRSETGMEHRGPGGKCLAGTPHGQQHLIVDRNQTEGAEGGSLVVGNNGRDPFTVVAHFAAGERRFVAEIQADELGPVGARKNAANSGRCAGSDRIDSENSGPGVRTRKDCCMQDARTGMVIGEPCPSANLFFRVASSQGFSDPFTVVHGTSVAPERANCKANAFRHRERISCPR